MIYSPERSIYYGPERFDLEVVAELDYSSGSYEFDLRVVWRHKKTGQLYTARDAGCSCPSPFEGYTRLTDLDTFSLSMIEEEARGRGDSAEFVQKIRVADERRKKDLAPPSFPGDEVLRVIIK